MNYLTKKNFGIPAGILAALSVLVGYSLYAGGISLVALVFVTAVFMFEFDENVKSSLKQSLVLAFFGKLVSFLLAIVYDVFGWFSGSSAYSVLLKIYNVVSDLVGFVFILLFASLLYSAIKNKPAKIDFLADTVNAAEKETVVCAKCGAPVEKGAAFCTKCGNKMD